MVGSKDDMIGGDESERVGVLDRGADRATRPAFHGGVAQTKKAMPPDIPTIELRPTSA